MRGHHFLLTCFIFIIFTSTALHAQDKINPTFEQVLSLRHTGSPVISPTGNHIAFTVSTTDWKSNRYDSEIWLSKNGSTPFQLTRTPEGSSGNIKWSPDGRWIGFVAKRGEKSQIFVINPEGGEAFPVTAVEENVQNFEWSPDGKRLAFTMVEKESESKETREDWYGSFQVEDQNFRLSYLWLIDFAPDLPNPVEIPGDYGDSTRNEGKIKLPEPEKLIDSVDFTISSFKWSPDGKHIAFEHRPNTSVIAFMDSDISLINVTSKEISVIAGNPGNDNSPQWSPDGKQILFNSSLDNRTSNFFKNNKIFRVGIDGKNLAELAGDFDENKYDLKWVKDKIYFRASQGTEVHLFSINPKSGKTDQVANEPGQIFGYSITPDGSKMAVRAANGTDLSEIYSTPSGNWDLQKISSSSKQIAQWATAKSEVVQWKSEDGATIEGVLHKPMDYDKNKKYPLLVMIHGGPTGVDRPTPILGYVYPAVQWLNKGAVILRVNYRGSAGYGEKFRELNVENLGVGDAWDVLSGVDYLAERGIIDTTRMGVMGWSQGGYISAFLTTTTSRFKAISVGAGISNWMTYYVNTDIHPFTRQYLKATPWENMEIYEMTSPMTYINQASTPTLIQHGEFDKRVPIPNAYELYQGLQDVGVETKLIVYKGFGHGITKPKERLAAVWHNWQWFGNYVWGEEIEIPVTK